MTIPKEYPQYFFMWTTGTPYITTVCAWSKKDCIDLIIKEIQTDWKSIYKRGGRIIKIKMLCQKAK